MISTCTMTQTLTSNPSVKNADNDSCSDQSKPATPHSRRVIFPSLHSHSPHSPSSMDHFLSPGTPDSSLSSSCEEPSPSSPPIEVGIPSLPFLHSPSAGDCSSADFMKIRLSAATEKYDSLRYIYRKINAFRVKQDSEERDQPAASSSPPRRCCISEVPRSEKFLPRLKEKLDKAELDADMEPIALKSCLRSNLFPSKEISKVSSVDSDLPSLASTSSQESDDVFPRPDRRCFAILPSMQRSISDPKSVVSFDPRVWVREFKRSEAERKVTWYGFEDMEAFKREAVKKILKYTEARVVKNEQGQIIRRTNLLAPGQAFFSHPALLLENEQDEPSSCKDAIFRKAVINNEINRILVVDPHDICLQLFTKALKGVFPHATIVTARSACEALQLLEGGSRFDIVLIEERLSKNMLRRHCENDELASHETSGSALIAKLKANMDKTLFIGTSANVKQDCAELTIGGADFVWAKPPPSMTPGLVDDLLRALLVKRGRDSALRALFQ